MRLPAGGLLFLIAPAAANTVSNADFEKLSALIDPAGSLTQDVADAEAETGGITGPGYCLTLLRHDLQLATAEIRQLQSIVLISAKISNPDEESFSVKVLATAVDTSASIVGALRSDIT